MSWIIVALSLGLSGLGVLGFLAVRVVRAATGLRREIDRANGRLEPVRLLFGDQVGAVQAPRG